MRFFSFQFARFLGTSILISLLGIALLQAVAESNELRPYTNNPILAVVDGKPLILDELKNFQVHDTMVRLYQMQSQILKERVLQELVNNHPELKLENEVPLPSQDDIARFYKNTPGIKEMGTLEKMHSERTILVIAHRLSTVIGADNIIVVDGGKIIEQGSYASVIKNNSN